MGPSFSGCDQLRVWPCSLFGFSFSGLLVGPSFSWLSLPFANGGWRIRLGVRAFAPSSPGVGGLHLWKVLRFPFSFCVLLPSFPSFLWSCFLPIFSWVLLCFLLLWVLFCVEQLFPLPSVGWCCSTPTKKGKNYRETEKKASSRTTWCRKRGLTRQDRSIWAIFPPVKIYSPFFDELEKR